MNIIVGKCYHINVGWAKPKEEWLVLEVWEEKGVRYVKAESKSTGHIHTFSADKVEGLSGKMSNKIVSESVEYICDIGGVEMWVERIDNWPDHKRRGRKPKVAA